MRGPVDPPIWLGSLLIHAWASAPTVGSAFAPACHSPLAISPCGSHRGCAGLGACAGLKRDTQLRTCGAVAQPGMRCTSVNNRTCDWKHPHQKGDTKLLVEFWPRDSPHAISRDTARGCTTWLCLDTPHMGQTIHAPTRHPLAQVPTPGAHCLPCRPRTHCNVGKPNGVSPPTLHMRTP